MGSRAAPEFRWPWALDIEATSLLTVSQGMVNRSTPASDSVLLHLTAVQLSNSGWQTHDEAPAVGFILLVPDVAMVGFGKGFDDRQAQTYPLLRPSGRHNTAVELGEAPASSPIRRASDLNRGRSDGGSTDTPAPAKITSRSSRCAASSASETFTSGVIHTRESSHVAVGSFCSYPGGRNPTTATSNRTVVCQWPVLGSRCSPINGIRRDGERCWLGVFGIHHIVWSC